jgi:hypothetical protein
MPTTSAQLGHAAQSAPKQFGQDRGIDVNDHHYMYHSEYL